MSSILFCSHPLSPREVDPDFAGEHAAAKAAGFRTALFDHTRATEGDPLRAIRGVPSDLGETVYRGWMMRACAYEALYQALSRKGAHLINDPAAYRLCHHLPESYAILEGHTPRSVWLPVHDEIDFPTIFDRLRAFGSAPLIVKDHVKSQKHYWNEACFIPRADDVVAVERVVRRFVELQGEDLAEGLVFREYMPLRIVGAHPQSGMPLGAEVRTFWLDGQMVLKHAYWDTPGTAALLDPPMPWMQEIADRVKSRFFTMDVALREDGSWIVIELGDGQVAGLPTAGVAGQLYARLHELLRRPERG